MLKKVINNLYEINKMLLYNFTDKNLRNHISQVDERNLGNLNIKSLKILKNALEEILKRYDAFYIEEFEIALTSYEESLIFRRIYNQVCKYINNYIKTDSGEQPLFVFVCDFEDNHIKNLDDVGGYLFNLEENIINDVDSVFIYMVFNSSVLDSDMKQQLFLNLMYMNPYLEEKLKDHNKTIEDYLIDNNKNYNNLNNMMRTTYDNYLLEYTLNSIKDIFYVVLTNKELSNKELETYELYLRSLFSNISEETLTELYFNFTDINIEILNKDGEQIIKNAFEKASADKVILSKFR